MKKYSVEIWKGPSAAMVQAVNPKDAVLKVLKEAGYYKLSKRDIVSSDIPGLKPVNVCLLGGARESVSWYGIIGFKPADPM